MGPKIKLESKPVKKEVSNDDCRAKLVNVMNNKETTRNTPADADEKQDKLIKPTAVFVKTPEGPKVLGSTINAQKERPSSDIVKDSASDISKISLEEETPQVKIENSVKAKKAQIWISFKKRPLKFGVSKSLKDQAIVTKVESSKLTK